jgi:hypothetical protein
MMAYEGEEEVKTVVATILVKMQTNKVPLLRKDYNKSDGTDAGALQEAFKEIGIDWDEMELHEILSIEDIM